MVAEARREEALKQKKEEEEDGKEDQDGEAENEGAEKNSESKSGLEKNFVKFLKSKREFHKSEIQQKLRRGELDFEGAAAILHELCIYNEANETYSHKGPMEDE